MRNTIMLGAALVCAFNPGAVLAAEETDTPTLLAYLGLSAADGKTTVGDNAAAVEAAMLVSALAVAAAQTIKTNIKDAAEGKSVVFVAKDEKFSLLPYRQADRVLSRLETQTEEFKKLDRGTCEVKPTGGPKSIFWSTENPVSETPSPREFGLKPSDILGAFQTTTELTAAPFDPTIELIKASLGASTGTVPWTSPGDVVDTPENVALRDRLAAVETLVKPYAGKGCPGNEAISKAADAILAAGATLTASKDGAPSLLDQAGAVASFGDKANLRILRFEVAKAGGTLVNASNIWTSLGIPALTMRGGLVTTYRLVNPKSGRTEAAGIVTCRYPNQLLLSINKTPPKPKTEYCETLAAGT